MKQDVDVMRLYRKLIVHVLPDLPNGDHHPMSLEIISEDTPQCAWINPVNVLRVGHQIMKIRRELPASHQLSDSVVFVRGDGVVDGWTKVYHMSLLISEVERPRRPGNCLDFLTGDVNENNPIEWGVIQLRVRPHLDEIRAQVADMLNVGDGAYLFAVARGFTHGPNTWLSAFNQPGA